MGAHNQADDAPEEFRAALTEFRSCQFRPELHCEEMPAPQRIAPYSAAVSADLTVDGEELGTGRLVLLYDPAGNDAWGGCFRCVSFVRADIEPELVIDALLGSVGWSWLIENLDAAGAKYARASGTVTKVASEGFGGMADDPSRAELEIRASWTPQDSITPHVQAWGDLLCTAAGLPPLPSGVVMLPKRRGTASR